ncbi:MAG: (2Fe-2S)-binding protein [Nitrospirota bacterium]|nr:MAG: (2Fe-2S)-binding protein [Nitrospirota bacterium]
MKIPVIIDGQLVKVEKGTSVIKAAGIAGITIPTLCYHDALKPYGACRICMVEVIYQKQRRVVTACNFPTEAGMEVHTDTAKVREIRRMVIRLLLARCPDVPILKKLAQSMGIEDIKLKQKDEKECILCGLCVRFCDEVVGANAIGLSNRGIEREVTTPFKVLSGTCIGCGSCTYICPTGCIEMVVDGEKTGMRMEMGNISIDPCQDNYECETCDVDKEFMTTVKRVFAEFRNKYSSH